LGIHIPLIFMFFQSFELPSLPLTNPVLIFTLVLLIVLTAPIIFRKIRVPGIIGLIVAGILAGPHGLGFLDENSGIKLFSTAGMLYLMFLVGLELDLKDFKKNQDRSLVFGLLTFFIPLGLGFIASYYVLHYSIVSSLLLASMFSTHTLISYPIASRLGITRNEAVTITIGGTIITDTAVLLMLAVISASTKGELGILFWLRIVTFLIVFVAIILYGIPPISRWFLRNLESDSGSQYIYVITIVFLSGILAQMAGIEPIIGAFLAGLALNRLIPHTSALMNRVVFIGNTFFIPIFLISVGMLVDYKILFHGSRALIFAGLLVFIAIFSKYAAAWLTQKIYGYTRVERSVIFGLSVSHAAAIIAVILVGYKLNLLDVSVLNGTILIILISCLVSSFTTEIYGRKLAITELQRLPSYEAGTEKILVPVSNPATVESLVDFALLVKEPLQREPIFMLTVVPDDEKAREQILKNNKMFESAIVHASATDNTLQLVSRVDLNVTNGITRAIKELMITKVLVGWNGKSTTTNYIFGSLLDNLISKSEQMIVVIKMDKPISSIRRLIVTVPPNAEWEIGWSSWISTLLRISRQINTDIVFYGVPASLKKIGILVEGIKLSTKIFFRETSYHYDLDGLRPNILPEDMLVVINARHRTVSHNPHLENVPKTLSHNFQQNCFIIIYPEQKVYDNENLSSRLEGMDISPITENIDRLSHLGKKLSRAIQKKNRS
jgi:Kef-type K+ transport system membrane component KefB